MTIADELKSEAEKLIAEAKVLEEKAASEIATSVVETKIEETKPPVVADSVAADPVVADPVVADPVADSVVKPIADLAAPVALAPKKKILINGIEYAEDGLSIEWKEPKKASL